MTIKPCKHCGRTGSIIQPTAKIESRMAEKCIYCKGRGYINDNNDKEVKK